MELQQPEFDVRQLGLFGAGLRLAADFALRAIFAVGGNDFLAVGIDNAFGAVQCEAKDAVQSGLGDGRIRACAAVDLLFRERLRRQIIRLERLCIGVGVVRGSVLVFVPLVAVLAPWRA